MAEYLFIGVFGVVVGAALSYIQTRDALHQRYKQHLTSIIRETDLAGYYNYPQEEANKRLMKATHLAYVALGVRDPEQDPYEVTYIAIKKE